MTALLPLLTIALMAPPAAQDLGPSAQALISGGTIVSLDPDSKGIRGFDQRGRRRWRSALKPARTGRAKLLDHGGVVSVQHEDTVAKINLESGALSPALPSPVDTGCRLEAAEGARGLRCPCSFQFAGPVGAPFGPRYRFHSICRRPYGGGAPSCGCWGSDARLVGRAGDLLIARLDAPPKPGHKGKRRTYEQILVGVSATTGTERWRRTSTLAPTAQVNGSGFSADKASFWIADSKGSVAVYESRSGHERWRHTATPESGPPAWIEIQDGEVVLSANGKTSRLDLRLDLGTGAVLSQTATGTASTTILASALPVGRLTTAPFEVTIQTQPGRIQLSPHAQFVRLGDGLLTLDAGVLALRDVQGKIRQAVEIKGQLQLGEGLIVVSTRSAVRLFARGTLAPVGRHPAKATVVAVEGSLGPGGVLLIDRSAGTPHARLLRADVGSIRRR